MIAMDGKKNPVAQALVAMRNKKLSPAQRKEIAQKAARARWGKPSSVTGLTASKQKEIRSATNTEDSMKGGAAIPEPGENDVATALGPLGESAHSDRGLSRVPSEERDEQCCQEERPATPAFCMAGPPPLLDAIADKKDRLDRLRPFSPEALHNLEHYCDVEITWTSNALEGNTLGPVETTLVIEQGVTIGGKPLRDHLEALDHYDAIRYVRELARERAPVTEGDVRNLHRLVVQRSRPDIAGRYADLARFLRTETGRHEFPSPAEIPALMGDFAEWLGATPASPEAAFTAHLRLVAIHPFNDGNGRTARLLMNLILIRGGYPPIAIRPEDRAAYVRASRQAQAEQGSESFDGLLCERLDATLEEYLKALQEPRPTH